MSDTPLPADYFTRTSAALSVTRLFGLGLSPGKLRGLQRISNDNGTLTMVATDQNSAMIGLIQEARGDKKYEPTFDEMADAKCELAASMSPIASGVLIDAYYGALSAVASWSLPPRCGMLVRIEKSGAKFDQPGPAQHLPKADYEEGMSVGKVKRMGADAVKLLAPFEPTQHDSAEHQMAFVQEIYEECKRHDILMVLEPVAIEFVKKLDGEKPVKESKKAKDKEHYVLRKARTVIDTGEVPVALLRCVQGRIPGTLGHETDKQLEENLRELNAACHTPWVLLSAGVDFDQFKKQVEMAVAAGASGVLGGRAFWKEYFVEKHKSAAAGSTYLRDVCADRVRQVHEIVKERAQPWFRRYG